MADGGLFAGKDSWVSSLATPLLLIALIMFGATVFLAIRSSGDVWMDENQV